MEAVEVVDRISAVVHEWIQDSHRENDEVLEKVRNGDIEFKEAVLSVGCIKGRNEICYRLVTLLTDITNELIAEETAALKRLIKGGE